MQNIAADLRYGLRLLWRHPGFSTLALLTLALGIGANTAVFSLVRGVLLRPLPYQNPEELIWIGGHEARFANEKAGISYPDMLDAREQARTLQGLAAYTFFAEKLIVTGTGEPEQIDGIRVTSNFFDVLGVRPAMGRAFQEGEDKLGGPRVAMLSHELWMRSYGGQPGIVGSTVVLNSISHQIVGVMPAGFGFPRGTAIWVPIQYGTQVTKMREARTYLGVARTKSVTLAGQEFAAIAGRLEQNYPDTNRGARFDVLPLAEHVTGGVRGTLYLLGGITAFLLLIGSANIANLLLARAAGRQREIAVRHALGASRRTIIRQLLMENIVLAVMGGALGSLLAWWAIRSLRVLNPAQLPRVDELTLDPAVLLFAMGISVTTALLFGLAPAMQASRGDQQEALKDAGARGANEGAGRARLRSLLVVAEVAIAMVLLCGAGLLLESLRKMLSVDPGFQAANAITTEMTLPIRKFRTLDGCSAFIESYLERLRALPRVEAAGAAVALPMGSVYSYYEFRIAGDAPPPVPPIAGQTAVTPGYFESMGIPLKQGRLFQARDTKDAPKVVVISEPMARQYLTGRDPVGQRLQMLIGGQVTFEGEIVGVVGGVRHENLTQAPRVEFYVPMAQHPYPLANFVVRSRDSAPETVAAAMKQALRDIDKDMPLYRVRPLEDVVLESAAEARARGFLTALFAAAALLLASIGIYGVMSYAVSRRAQEIGIRMALGAAPPEILRMVLGQSGKLVLIALTIGLAITLALGRLLQTMLYGVESFDARVLGGVTALLLVVALAATAVPAWRAARIHPSSALRQG
ncbi:MAG: ABC transporter permease [Acidobacteria bacterium]|nr:ABC transporter permease [Acidobacteriota bacterium]